MPALVLAIAILFGGHWEINTFNATDRNATITGAIFFYGLATGIVEELIFRGIIMGCLEKRFNIRIAVIVGMIGGAGVLLFIGGEKLYNWYKEHFADQISLTSLKINLLEL